MKVITINCAVNIYKKIIKRAEDMITEDFIKRHPNTIFRIGYNVEQHTDQFLISKDYGEDIRLQNEKNHEIRLTAHFNVKTEEIIIKGQRSSKNNVYDKHIEGKYIITNPLMLQLIRKGYRYENNEVYNRREIIDRVKAQSRTFVDTKSLDDGLSELLDHMLNFRFNHSQIIFSMGGTGSYYYDIDNNRWNRIYGKPKVLISEDSEVINIGFETKSEDKIKEQ